MRGIVRVSNQHHREVLFIDVNLDLFVGTFDHKGRIEYTMGLIPSMFTVTLLLTRDGLFSQTQVEEPMRILFLKGFHLLFNITSQKNDTLVLVHVSSVFHQMLVSCQLLSAFQHLTTQPVRVHLGWFSMNDTPRPLIVCATIR